MKNKVKVILSVFVLILFSLGCSDSFLEPPTEETIIDNTPQLDIEQARKDFAALSFETGANDFELNVLYNQKWVFRLMVPEIEDNELAPLFVDLHPGALTPRPTYHTFLNCSFRNALEENGMKAYVLSPNAQGVLWYDTFNDDQVVNLVKFAIENLNVDPNKIVVTGYSDGGNGSWFHADMHPDIFSAAIPLASSYPLRTTADGLVKKIEVPIYAIQGENDVIFPYTNIETRVEQAINVGSEIILVKGEDLDHNTFCSYVPYVKDALEWLETSVWN